MKVGILTYQRAHNYGALLQAYALQSYVRSQGHEVNMIDYWPEYHAQDYKLIPYFKSISSLGKIKSIVILMIGLRRILQRAYGYKKFMKQNFNLSSKVAYPTESSMKDINYDLVIYGSDQIWRRSNYPLFKGFSDVFFGFYPINASKKITYAASMGIINVDDQDKIYLAKMLKNFDAISVREEELKELVEEVIEEKVSLVLDPVFLLTKKQWLSLNNSSELPKKKEKYIFFYQLTPSEEAIEFVDKLSAHYGYKIIEVRGRVEPLLFEKRYYQTANPNDFIDLIANAEIVVSTSFHGVAFSLIFEKEFYALGMGKNSGRVQTLLDNLNISERLLSHTNLPNTNDKINYEVVSLNLQRLKLHSENYILTNLNNC
ncbi:polysaccharide pyruvyl transferase family protein [Flavobacterium ustbae]|uniref:polysaccharide pyruvyl transferase family protein n=1 Tax=Flavobacterium ustbae TaxID=2488790 RepID=UPI000F7985BB|nr:polysaccharide pyruvyl transferase family protein [Flavobacterium ustbae]